jgi:hypothetical protein
MIDCRNRESASHKQESYVRLKRQKRPLKESFLPKRNMSDAHHPPFSMKIPLPKMVQRELLQLVGESTYHIPMATPILT